MFDACVVAVLLLAPRAMPPNTPVVVLFDVYVINSVPISIVPSDGKFTDFLSVMLLVDDELVIAVFNDVVLVVCEKSLNVNNTSALPSWSLKSGMKRDTDKMFCQSSMSKSPDCKKHSIASVSLSPPSSCW